MSIEIFILLAANSFIILLLFSILRIEDYISGTKRNYFILGLLMLLALIIVSIFFVPIWLTKGILLKEVMSNSKGELSTSSSIGDAFNGMLAPSIALASVVVTFLAFYIQKIANDQVRNQFKVQQFESKFFQMLKLHKENISEMRIEGYDFEPLQVDELKEGRNGFIQTMVKAFKKDSKSKKAIYSKKYRKTEGRKIFVTMQLELESIVRIFIYVEKQKKSDYELTKQGFIKCYDVFFNGLDFYETNMVEGNFYFHLKKARDQHGWGRHICYKDDEVRKHYKINGHLITKLPFNYKPYSGHASRLGHYYRHLFMAVRFVVEEPIIDGYAKKMKYLKMLRAQLSNHEQIIMFYNWLSTPYGGVWEEESADGNKFFTRFKMIHNLWHDRLLIEDVIYEELMKFVNEEKRYNLNNIGDMFEISAPDNPDKFANTWGQIRDKIKE